jgi:transposase
MSTDERLEKIEAMLTILIERQTDKEWYSVEEIAKILGRAEFTVREWCRHRRVHCQKKYNGRGKYQSWVIARGELLRIQREGLLPLHKRTSSLP